MYLALVGSMCTEVPTMDLKTAFLLPDAMSSSSRRIAVGSSDRSRCHGWQPPATIRPGYAERLREYILGGRFWYRTVFSHCPPRRLAVESGWQPAYTIVWHSRRHRHSKLIKKQVLPRFA